MSLLGILAGIAVLLTCVMFATRQSMLGFACAIFWAITGAQAYTLSTTPWGDIYYYLFFASAFGMTIFTAIAAFGLREKRDTIADKEIETGEGEYIDEGEGQTDLEFHSGEEKQEPSARVQALRKRATERRKKYVR